MNLVSQLYWDINWYQNVFNSINTYQVGYLSTVSDYELPVLMLVVSKDVLKLLSSITVLSQDRKKVQ